MKKIIPYIIAVIAGVVLWIIVTPWAQKERNYNGLVGGEMFFPVYTVGITALVKHKIKNTKSNKEDE